jgi:hypothetical protein
VGLWKRWVWKKHAVEWQPNFFDHRLRGEETRRRSGSMFIRIRFGPGWWSGRKIGLGCGCRMGSKAKVPDNARIAGGKGEQGPLRSETEGYRLQNCVDAKRE